MSVLQHFNSAHERIYLMPMLVILPKNQETNGMTPANCHFKQLIINYYRPQQSCGKVMFLHLCVILLTGLGGFCPGGSPSGRGSLSGEGFSVQGVSVQGVSVQGGSLSRGVPVRETPHTGTCGQYAS